MYKSQSIFYTNQHIIHKTFAIMATIVQELFLAVAIISSISWFGATFGYFTFKRLNKNESVFTLFSAYLMILLAVFMFLLLVIKSKIVPGVYIAGGKGFIIGFIAIFAIMNLYHRLSKRRHDSQMHIGLGLVLFFMLMIHEMLEGLAVADIFFEASGGGTGLVFASAATLFVLAIHEFPEGILLVLPFFLVGENKKGLFAVLINMVVFAGSAIFSYFIFLRYIELTPHQEAMFSGIPAGGIFFLGLHEAKNALQKGVRGASRASKTVLGGVSLLITGVVIFVLVHTNEIIESKKEVRISGYEKSATGELIPIIYADPCAHEINLHDCLD